MPDSLKKELSRPYGFLFTNTSLLISFLSNKRRIITVGDVVTQTLIENGVAPFLSITDGKTKRKISMNIDSNYTYKVKNEKSTIRLSAMKIIENILSEDKPSSILVDGEEDLLVIPVVLFGKEGDIIVYGQPNAGAVVVKNNKFVKERVKQIFEKFYLKKC